MGALMAAVEQIWLVEICVLSSVDVPAGMSRLVTYEEVLASNEYDARLLGFSQFRARVKYEPVARRKLANRNLQHSDCHAPTAVEMT